MGKAVHRYKHLAPNPRSSYRQLFIKGTRIRAVVIYNMARGDEEVRTPKQIASDMDLPLQAVNEAIAYCESNPPEVAEDFAVEEALIEAAGMKQANRRASPKVLTPQEVGEIEKAVRARLRNETVPG